MPFSEWARREMLTIWEQGLLTVRIGDVNGPDEAYGEAHAEFHGPGASIGNDRDLLFPRAQAERAQPYTHWFLIAPGGEVARDKLERPILLRKGERATFPPGALRLEVT